MTTTPSRQIVTTDPSADKPDSRDLRNTLASFATGVTIVTALDAHGEPVGLTVSSFNSVSLDPPLILWSLSLPSPILEAFDNGRRFAVNVLSAGQEEISNRFASRREDRFVGLSLRTGLGGVPLIDGCCSWFECITEARYPEGDHLILIGRIERFARGSTTLPLIFHDGCYRHLASLPQAD